MVTSRWREQKAAYALWLNRRKRKARFFRNDLNINEKPIPLCLFLVVGREIGCKGTAFWWDMQALSVYFGQKALEMVLEEACEVLRDSLPDATLTPLGEGQLGAFFHVFFEDMSLLQGDVAVGEDCCNLVGQA